MLSSSSSSWFQLPANAHPGSRWWWPKLGFCHRCAEFLVSGYRYSSTPTAVSIWGDRLVKYILLVYYINLLRVKLVNNRKEKLIIIWEWAILQFYLKFLFEFSTKYFAVATNIVSLFLIFHYFHFHLNGNTIVVC